MPLSRDIQNIIDDYADGKLSDEEVRKLASLLKEDEEVREQLALATVLERLLRTLGKGPVPTAKIMAKIKGGDSKPEPAPSETPAKQRIVAPGILKSPPGSGSRRSRKSGTVARSIAFVTIAAVMTIVSIAAWRKWKEYEDFTAHIAPDKTTVTSTTIKSSTTENGNNTTATTSPSSIKHVSIAKALEPFFSEDLPDPPEGEDLTPPSGNGETEPGFVAPPAEWLSSKPDSKPQESSTEGPMAPILFTKIKHGDLREWAATPQDVKTLLGVMEKDVGIRYGMNSKDFYEIDLDPSSNPILFFTGHYNFVLKPGQRKALRKFILRGGMIIFNAGLGSKPFYNSARREMRLILPELPIKRLGADHPIFHSRYDLYDVKYNKAVRKEGYFENIPWLEGITLSCRTAVVISRWGIAAGWEGKESDSFLAYRTKDSQRLGINLMAYGASIRAWAKRSLPSYEFKEINTSGTGAMLIAQIEHSGDWRTRYAGLTILLHSFNRRTEVPVKLTVKSMKLTDNALFNAPVIYLTGHESLSLSKQEREALGKYITNGGFLFAEACCGRKGFDKDFRKLMADLFPKNKLAGIPANNDIFKIPNKIELLGVTPALGTAYGSMLIPPGLEGVKIDDNYGVVYSPHGMAGSWETSQTPYAHGYEDPDTLKLGQNILMYAITQ